MHVIPALQQILVVAVPVADNGHAQGCNDSRPVIDDKDDAALTLGRIPDAVDDLVTVHREQSILGMQHHQQAEYLTLVLLLGEPHTRHTVFDVVENLHATGLGSFFSSSMTCLRTFITDWASVRLPISSLPLPSAATISGSIRTSPPAVMIGT